jgi:hypothetical protein
MLTEIDIHILIGILYQNSTIEDIDIILGDRIYDKASKIERDIDITIDKKIGTFKLSGLEVKDHTRPLTVEHIEQLVLKLKDIENFNQRGVVSASGYTKSAINKAKFHNLDLYELKDWENTQSHFKHFSIPESFEFRTIYWKKKITGIECQFVDDNIPKFSKHPKVADFNKQTIAGISDVGEYTKELLKSINIGSIYQVEEIPLNTPTRLKIPITLDSKIYANIKKKFYEIKVIIVELLIEKIETKIQPNFKILVKLDDLNFSMGCVLAELPDKSLVGFSTSEEDKAVKLITIPQNQRLIKKIQGIRLNSK